MIRKPAPGDERRPAILVSDTAPLSLLATVPGALDWLFLPGCEIWIPDIILDEVLRNPGEGRISVSSTAPKSRAGCRATVIGSSGWRRGSASDTTPKCRATRMPWISGGRLARLRGSSRCALSGRIEGPEPVGRREHRQRRTGHGESVIALADDHNVRAAIEARGRQKKKSSIDLMSTQTFIQWMAEDFAVEAALTAWDAIEIARQGKVPAFNSDFDNPNRGADDPVYIRVP